ncbi:uncharacterized protein B0P05DRAFT_480015, partial [Gilbertella persicaria]|uniref:uncharacterized protein n=1 Tax=Gilbertella persicaria TaxID=101096 RepID=UPI0022205257
FATSTRGLGAWKANPNLAKKKEFRQQLAAFLDTLVLQLQNQRKHYTAQRNWDWIKAEVKLFTKSFQLETVNWRNKQIKRLQRKRNKILRHQKHRGIVDWTLPIVKKQLGALQEEAAEIDALRAGKRW